MTPEDYGIERGGQIIRRGVVDGIPWLILPTPLGNGLNGYAQIPEGHPWRGREYDEIDVDVHHGLTYGDGAGWVGFDTSHAFDVWPEAELQEAGVVLSDEGRHLRQIMEDMNEKHPLRLPAIPGFSMPRWEWSVNLLVMECESLARQIAVAGATVAQADAAIEKEEAE